MIVDERRSPKRSPSVSFSLSSTLLLHFNSQCSVWESSKASWTEEPLQHPPKRTLYFCPPSFSIHLRLIPVMVWQRKLCWHQELFPICLLRKTSSPTRLSVFLISLKAVCAWGLHAVAAHIYSNSLYSDIQFPQDLWIGFLCSNNILLFDDGCILHSSFMLVNVIVFLFAVNYF